MKILVRGTNWIGDAVMSIPALRQLRRIFPEALITLHTRSWAEGLFHDATFIDELVTFEKNRWKIRDVYDNSKYLRDDEYDLAILFPNSFESALTSFLTRIPRRIGYNKDVRGLLLTDPVAVPEWKNRRHEVFYYLHLIAEVERRILGRETVDAYEPDSTLEISDERRDAAKVFLSTAGVDLSKKIVALGVGSTNSLAKRWPAQSYALVNDRLQAELDCATILIGSKDETAVAMEVARRCKTPSIDLTGKTELGEAVAILSVVDLFISNDMGLAHATPATGTPTIVIFGPTNPITTRPFSPNAETLQNPSSSAIWVSPDEVFEAASRILKESEVSQM